MNKLILLIQLSFFTTIAASVDSSNCVDMNGVERKLNTTWKQYPWCSCSCSSKKLDGIQIAVVDCDAECYTHQSGPKIDRMFGYLSALPEKPYPELFGLPGNYLLFGRNNYKSRKSKTDCVYSLTGLRYLEGEQWPSMEVPCGTCICVSNGITCKPSWECSKQVVGTCKHNQSGEIVNAFKQDTCCMANCEPGYELVTESKFEEIEEKYYSNCSLSVIQTENSYFLGNVLVRPGPCVDQVCRCLSGKWNCVESCLDGDEKCSKTDLISWDPFCCPRCKGNKVCGKNQAENMPIINAGFSTFINSTQCFCLSGSFHCTGKVRKTRVIGFNHTKKNTNKLDDSMNLRGQSDWCQFATESLSQVFTAGEVWTEQWPSCSRCRCYGNNHYECEPIPCEPVDCTPDEIAVFDEKNLCCPKECVLVEAQYLHGKPEDNNHNDSQKSKSNPHSCSPIIHKNNTEFPSKKFSIGDSILIPRPCLSLLCKCNADGSWICDNVKNDEFDRSCLNKCTSEDKSEKYWKRMTFGAYILLGSVIAISICFCLSANSYFGYKNSEEKKNGTQLKLEAVNCLHIETCDHTNLRADVDETRLMELQRKFLNAQETIKLLPGDNKKTLKLDLNKKNLDHSISCYPEEINQDSGPKFP